MTRWWNPFGVPRHRERHDCRDVDREDHQCQDEHRQRGAPGVVVDEDEPEDAGNDDVGEKL
jgi:hypothetical protein